MLRIKFFLIFFILLLQSKLDYAQSLPKGSPELKQLVAMGYEIDKQLEDGKFTVASNGSNKILLSKNSDRIAIFRIFTREKELSDDEKITLYELVNKINTELSYQITLGDDYLAVVLYDYGSHNHKTFAKLVRLIEKSDSVFDSFPRLGELLN